MYPDANSADESVGDLGYNGYPVYLNYFTALPDPSILSDSSLTILFKSLLKKDSITKEKSLNDLLSLLDNEALTDVFRDELTIMSWIQLYPKLAIENTKNIRSLSHQVQGKFLSTVGGREYSKYLKSSIPIWLSGIFDNEKSVSNAAFKTLVSSFQNDNDKVTTKVWIIFFDQILNFIFTSITIENPDSLSDSRYTNESDSDSKYERLLNGALQMLIRIIEHVNEERLILEPTSIEKLESILANDELWNYLGTSCSSERLNIGLFKTLLVLLKFIFAAPISKFTGSLHDSKSLYKFISKKFIKNVNFKNNKTSNIVFSSAILQFWDTIITLTQFDEDKNFWDLGGSKSGSRFIDYLKLGPCNSSEIYYILIRKILTVIPRNSAIDFSSLTVYEKLNQIVCQQLSSLNNAKFVKECILSLVCLYDQFSASLDKSLLIPESKRFFYTSIDSLSKRYFSDKQAKENLALDITKFMKAGNNVEIFQEFQNSAIAQSLSSSSDFKIGEFVFNSSFDRIIDTYFRIVKNFEDDSFYENMINNIIDSLQNNSKGNDQKISLQVLESYMDIIGCKNSNLVNFFGSLADSNDPNFVVSSLNIYFKYLNSATIDETEKKSSVNRIFNRISSTDHSNLSNFISTVAKNINIFIDLGSYPEIYEYLVQLSESEDLSAEDLQLCFSYSSNQKIFSNLLSVASLDRERALRFITLIANNPPNLVDKELDSLTFVVNVAFEEIPNKDCASFISNLKSSLTNFKSIVWNYITSASISTDFSHLVNCLEESEVPLEEIEDVVRESLNKVSSTLLSISNPLEQNIYLVKEGSEEGLNSSLLVFGKIILPMLGKFNSPRLLVLAALVGEYIGDYLFLESSNNLEVEKLLDIRKQLTAQFLSTFHDLDVEKILSQLSQKSPISDDGIASTVIDILSKNVNGNDIYGFYSTRAFKSVFDLYFDNITLSQFESIGFDFYSLIRKPLLLASLLTSCNKLITNDKFNRVRNYVAAEILGARSEVQVREEGLKWVTLCTNFYQANEDFEVIPAHRLTLIINHISKWMESDYAYDSWFIKVRVQVTRFLIGLILSNPSLPDSFWELTSSILDDNLGLAVTEISHLDLRYFTIKLYSICVKQRQLENISDLKSEILEIFLDNSVQVFDGKQSNQPVHMYNDLLTRVLSGIDFPIKLLSEKENDLYRTFFETEFVDVQRASINQLKRMVLQNQQDFVLEYQLNKSNLGQEDTEEISSILPAGLTSQISNIYHGDIDNPITPGFTRYVWSWYLMFSYFSEVTYSIRNEYVKQLVDLNAFESLFDFIFSALELNDSKLLRMLTTGDISKSINASEILINDYSVNSNSGKSLNDEMAFALVHLYYLSLKYSGSQVQLWYNGIRHRQLKQSIEKFTVKYVSPLLISKILLEATDSKSKLESKDENLTLKINNVTNEIKSIYIIDEQIMEMIIKIPALYPLENVTVEGPTRLGVKENQWKAWLLASQRVISLTNGSVIDAVELFNKNVNLHFSGFEDCAICYSILHQDLSLPSKVCPTCSNKFHAACLYKWFKSSNSSTCPLCRSAFNFRTRN
ncbi:hypothetical protein DFJ63DRAFT_290762 [Scheffersomyces coipomensis]|uniref:uncharacterized protein n=1 Tax=Scheffersomyces coipomensis TaxID=1788519 RepID=UPI00315D481A